jgi:hypothetical protein
MLIMLTYLYPVSVVSVGNYAYHVDLLVSCVMLYLLVTMLVMLTYLYPVSVVSVGNYAYHVDLLVPYVCCICW